MSFTKNISLLFLIFWSNLSIAQSELQIVNIGDFTTTTGSIIEDCKVAFRSTGKLNADKNNIVLWATWFTGSSADVINSGSLNSIDTSGLYIIVVDALTNGVSSSPSNTVDFPVITIRDMVNSQHSLLVNHLGIDHLYAVMGISMGGMQTFEWLVAYPEFMDKAISIVGTPKETFHDVLVWQTMADLIIEAGSDEKALDFAIKKAYDILSMQAQTPVYLARTVNPDSLQAFRKAAYANMMHPHDYLGGLQAMIPHNIYRSANKDADNIKNIIKAEVLIVAAKQDHLVNPITSVELSKLLACQYLELSGDCGHIAAFCEQAKIKEETYAFLK